MTDTLGGRPRTAKLRSEARRRDVWAQPVARQFLLSQGAGQAADAVTALVLARVLLSDGSSGIEPALLLQTIAVAAVPYAVVGPISGVIADHWNRRRALVVANAARAAVTTVAMVAVQLGDRTLGLVAAASLLSLARLVYTLRAASLSRAVPTRLLVAADSAALLVGAVAGGIGAALGSAGALHRPSLLLGVAALAQVAAAGGFLLLPCDLGGHSMKRSVPLGVVARRVVCLLTSSPTRFAIAVTSGHRALLGALFATFVILVSNDYGFGASGYVAAIVVTGTGSFVGTLTAPSWIGRFGLRGTVFVAFVVPAVVLPVGAAVGTRLVVAGSLTLAFFLFQNLRVLADAIVQSNIADDARARVFSIYDAAYNLTYFGGAAAAIALDTSEHGRPAIAVVGGCYAVTVVALVASRRPSLVTATTTARIGVAT